MDLAAAAEDVKAELAKAGASMAARGTVDLRLPIGAGRWGARFGIIRADEIDALQARLAAMPTEEAADHMAEIIAEACRCILVVTDDGVEEVTELDPPIPVRFGESFAEAIGLDVSGGVESMAEIVKGVWTTDDGILNATGLGRFGDRLLDWMADTTRPVYGELAGKSRSGTSSNGRPEPQPTA
jgi:muconolactone delta-isomerase